MTSKVTLEPIAVVVNTRSEVMDDYWGEVVSEIQLAPHIPSDAFDGIDAFSLLEVIYHFHLSDPKDAVFVARPRGNPDYPLVGIFAQRKRDRPNGIGLCRVQLVKREGRSIFVKLLDAINGTPVIDIKPVMREFQPDSPIHQPDWASDLMKNYWK